MRCMNLDQRVGLTAIVAIIAVAVCARITGFPTNIVVGALAGMGV